MDEPKQLKGSAVLNGMSASTILLQAATKHGPWALGCTVLCIAFYLCALKPMVAERKLLIDTLQQNSIASQETMARIAESTEQIAKSVFLQQATLERLDKALTDSTLLQKKTADTLSRFSEAMLAVHPEQHETINRILEILTERKPEG